MRFEGYAVFWLLKYLLHAALSTAAIRLTRISKDIKALRCYPPKQVKQLKAGFASQVPLGRIGGPDEIARAVVLLVSDDSSFVAGIELFVDGGTIQV
jgi:NAD(P)-dependent dehydrogenase (short-subunit alcohol dehydrogenase family)